MAPGKITYIYIISLIFISAVMEKMEIRTKQKGYKTVKTVYMNFNTTFNGVQLLIIIC